MVIRREVSVSHKQSRLVLATTGLAPESVKLDRPVPIGRVQLGGHGDSALNGVVTRMALFASALDLDAIARVVA